MKKNYHKLNFCTEQKFLKIKYVKLYILKLYAHEIIGR